MIVIGLFVLGTICLPQKLSAQDVDLEGITKESPIKVSGAISMMNRFYAADGIDDRQENFIWTLRGNLNFSIFGIAVPLSGTLTSQNKDFNQPYNRLSLRPRYKWAKAYIGYSNMTYSSYTLAGHTFLGGGVELNPNKIRFAANYGRFASAIPIDRPLNQAFVPAFTRTGGGAKIGYGTDENFIDLIFFKGKDDANSWDVIPDSTTVLPGENLVLGTAWKLSLVKNLSLSGEFARSAYTTDIRDEIVEDEPIFSDLGFDNRSSTTVRNAMKLSANYRIGGSTLRGTFERIDPEYQTMGAYFFNNDLENITAGFTTSLLERKLIITANGGVQRNNLSGDEIQTSTRTIIAGNIVFAKSPFTIGLTHSNYSSDIEFVLNSSLDSLNAVVVTRSTGLNGTYAIKSGPTKSHVVTASITRQAVTDDFSSGDRGMENENITGLINYALQLKNIKTEFSARLNYNRNDLNGTVNERFGPGVTAKRLFFEDKLTSQLIINYFSQEGNSTWNYIWQSSIKLKSHHVASLNVSRLSRHMMTGMDATVKFGETIATLNYTYSF